MKQDDLVLEEKAKKRSEGWAKFPNFIIDTGIWARLSPKAKSLYLVLLSHSHYVTRVGCLTVSTIKREAGLSKNYIPQARQELEDEGLIKSWRKGYLNFFEILDKGIYPHNADTYPLKEVSIRKTRTHTPRNKADGRWACPQKMDKENPQNTDTCPCPQNTDTKENKEYNKENSMEGSASACLRSQSSPSLNQPQNLKNMLIVKNHKQIKALLKNKGHEESIEVLCGQGLTHPEAYNTLLELRLEEERQ